MANLIYQTHEQALLAAQTDAIAQAEKAFDFRFQDEKVINSRAFMIESCSMGCTCGTTSGVRVILFADNLTNEMAVKDSRDITDMVDGQQFISAYGYCEGCGSENPMP